MVAAGKGVRVGWSQLHIRELEWNGFDIEGGVRMEWNQINRGGEGNHLLEWSFTEMH